MKLACPNCGSNVKYDIGTDRVHCEHCNSYTQIKDLNKNIKNDSTIDLKEHICVSCGANIITYDGSVIHNCNYCGSTNFTVNDVKSKIENTMILPFKNSKETFIKNFKTFISQNHISNEKFFKEASINEIVGIYVPVVMEDYDIKLKSKGRIKFFKENDYGIDINKSAEYSYSADYIGYASYDLVRNMPDYLLSNLLPFDFENAKPFSPYYIAGLSCSKVDDFKNDKLKSISKDMMRFLLKITNNNFLGADDFNPIDNTISLNRRNKAEYYFPFWLCSYTFDGKIYSFAMNGRNGNVISTLPKDEVKFKEELKAKNKRNRSYIASDRSEIFWSIFKPVLLIIIAVLIAFVIAGLILGKEIGDLPIISIPFLLPQYTVIVVVVGIVTIINIIVDYIFSKKVTKKKINDSLSNIQYNKIFNYSVKKNGKETKQVYESDGHLDKKDTIIIDGEEV